MTKLRPFQEEGVQKIYQFRGRALLADEQGLGKTIQSLAWIHHIPKRRPVVIICPATLKWTWQAEASMHFGMRAAILEGTKPKPGPIPKIVIINYEILKFWLPKLIAAHPQVVIFDEIHYLKDPNSQRTKAAFALIESGPASVLGLSGTPFENHPIEIWPIVRMINRRIFPSRTKFAWKYCKPKLTRYGWTYKGAVNKKQLHAKLVRTCMIRRLKKDVAKDLPDKSYKVISCKLKSYTEYNRATRDFLQWLRTVSPSRANKARRAAALVKVGYLLRLAARLKLQFTEAWIREFLESNPGEKLVGFTMNKFIIEHLKKVFPRALVIDGSVKGRKRFETVRQFQNNKTFPLLLANWKAGGIGLTLTAASHLAALDFPWTPGALAQGEDRIHRIGQKRRVMIYYLVALMTIEEKLMKSLQTRYRDMRAILDGKGGRSYDKDIFQELLEEIDKV